MEVQQHPCKNNSSSFRIGGKKSAVDARIRKCVSIGVCNRRGKAGKAHSEDEDKVRADVFHIEQWVNLLQLLCESLIDKAKTAYAFIARKRDMSRTRTAPENKSAMAH